MRIKWRKGLLWMFLVTLVATAIISQNIVAFETATVRVDPASISDTNLTPGETFSVNITVAGVEDLWGYEFILSYNSTVLTATDFASYNPFTLSWGGSEINDTLGKVFIQYSMPLGTPIGSGFTGTAPLARIDFTVDALGVSELDLHDATLSHPDPVTQGEITHDVVGGSFANIQVRDIAVTNVTVSPAPRVMPGESVSIDATIVNKGESEETFNVTASYDENSLGNESDIVLAGGESKTVSFTLNTTGMAEAEYTITVMAIIDMDHYPENNINSDLRVRVGVIRDVAIINFTTEQTWVGVGETVILKVRTENQGNFTEDFTLAGYYDNTTIDTEEVSLSEGITTERFFNWKTTDVTKGEYPITAKIIIDVDDDPDDNTMEAGHVRVGYGPSPLLTNLPYALAGAVAAVVAVKSIRTLRARRKSKPT